MATPPQPERRPCTLCGATWAPKRSYDVGPMCEDGDGCRRRAARQRGAMSSPVHVLDAGEYRAVVAGTTLRIVRTTTVGAVLQAEDPRIDLARQALEDIEMGMSPHAGVARAREALDLLRGLPAAPQQVP